VGLKTAERLNEMKKMKDKEEHSGQASICLVCGKITECDEKHFISRSGYLCPACWEKAEAKERYV